MAPVSEGHKKAAPEPIAAQGPVRFGAPSIRLFLVRSRRRRAELRFTGRHNYNNFTEIQRSTVDTFRGSYQRQDDTSNRLDVVDAFVGSEASLREPSSDELELLVDAQQARL